VAEHLAKCFVDHRNVSLAANRISELAFHHGERKFNVAALVVVLQELFSVVHEVVEHALIGPTDRTSRIGLERNEGRRDLIEKIGRLA
jgi:plasmid stabilization system protein ParE